jgi:hypothetical protein
VRCNRQGCRRDSITRKRRCLPTPQNQGTINNTIADNDGALGSGVYAEGFDAAVKLFNNIVVAKAGQTAVCYTST